MANGENLTRVMSRMLPRTCCDFNCSNLKFVAKADVWIADPFQKKSPAKGIDRVLPGFQRSQQNRPGCHVSKPIFMFVEPMKHSESLFACQGCYSCPNGLKFSP